MEILKQYEKPLKEYCKRNGFNYDTMKKYPRCGNDEVLFVQHYNKEDAVNGLKDETPAEVLIQVNKNSDGTYDIKKGQNAEKHFKL